MSTEMKHVTVQEVAALYKKEGNILLDVRNPDEVAEMSVPGALNIPLPDLEAQTDKVKDYSTVYVMCKGGVRSVKGTEILLNHGITQATDVLGGITAWKEAGLPVTE